MSAAGSWESVRTGFKASYVQAFGSRCKVTPCVFGLPTSHHSRPKLSTCLAWLHRLNWRPTMQTWKLKKKSKKIEQKTWKPRLAAVIALVATLAIGIYDFPGVWNRGAQAVQAQTGWLPPVIDEEPFRLGLDLQGEPISSTRRICLRFRKRIVPRRLRGERRH